MASSSPPPAQTPTLDSSRPDTLSTLKHYTSYTFLCLAPALLLLPPRKLDMYTLSLLGGLSWSGNQVLRERTGRGAWERIEASRRQKQLHHQHGLQHGHDQEQGPPVDKNGSKELRPELRPVDSQTQLHESKAAATAAAAAAENGGVAALAKEMWMGDAQVDWKERRIREEKQALEEGKGYGGIIWDQIWEVWNGGKGSKGGGD